ncbi:ABC transporter ATP-binding protein [Mucisphaera calidilacus]|uniref:Oligopeptide transport ATP-binding protein OppF n=1 Tax=Mucisphaera calidilacus TaxID=2527982 RepID=A0A518BZK9_9BACT|nr:oligopeptide/dipeptide ABC transporter ATP-binding protein [Mucisphaera calidilacus]QDU72405.1 Oligopeptide transport ATP-binding protein OppF [Mucisphaera calidilacus]
MIRPADEQPAPLLSVRDLKTHFPVKRGLLRRTVGHVRAVDGVSFDLGHGETLGLVGESGCGKSTVGRSILRLIPATSGQVLYQGNNVFDASSSTMLALRREMQIIFQDPVGSLNPRMRVESIIGEPIKVHGLARGSELDDHVADLLKHVGLTADHGRRYPHEFSGGQRQRIGIARALALKPKLIICDEPVSALDVSIQAQILNLLNDLQQEFGLSYLFIAHNLAVVEHFADRVAVMYLGRIVEIADRDTLYRNPIHPYTKALLSAAPVPDPSRPRNRIMLEGDVPSPIVMIGDDEQRNRTGAAHMRTENGVTFLDREALLDRPPLEPVPNEPGHYVSLPQGVTVD